MKVVYVSANFCRAAPLLLLTALLWAPTPAQGRGYALFKKDKERIVALVNKLKAEQGVDVKASWDRKLENTAGLECECGMITHSSATWGWAVVSRFQRHFQLYFGHEVGGLLGYTPRTPGDPYANQWSDISAIVKSWYKKGYDSFEHDQLLQSKRLGCAIFPTCYVGDTKLVTVLTCVFAPKAEPRKPPPGQPQISAGVEGSGEAEGSGDESLDEDAAMSNVVPTFSRAERGKSRRYDNEVENEGYMKAGIKILNKKL